MPLLFDIIETTTINSKRINEEFEVRLLRRNGDDWGTDDSLHMVTTFGYNEEQARNRYQGIVDSWRKQG